MKSRILIFLLYLPSLLYCSPPSEEKDPLFMELSAEMTGITFRNDLDYSEKVNPYTFRNFYNGAGVALGDINNDGLIDIFFAGNQTSNRLYLNEGNFKFKDITRSAGLESTGYWTTGVSMADINGDGLIDIYVCKSGLPEGEKRHNELFINQGDLTFKEMSKSFGLDDHGLSQHAVFFDYDKDGDLDFYLLSNSGRSVGIYDLREGQREIRDPEGGNKLYRNDGDRFTDVSEEAGIYGSAIGYGLGVTVADLNGDNWPDLYVSNDFFERDYLYINNQNGSFREILPESMPEISLGSMGADIADLDNDGLPDVFVTEMLPEDLARIKTKTPFEEWDKFQANFSVGYHRQFTRNTLQKNLGKHPKTGEPLFAEISRLTQMHATDWSWGALIFDADLDGWKDVFVANGIVKDLTDFDFVDFYLNKQQDRQQNKADSLLITKMIDEFPSNPLQNYWFKNLGNWNFENRAATSGLNQLTFSTGAAYGDLDNDGDLDLVINNLNAPAGIFKNTAREQGMGNFLKFDLRFEFGTKITLKTQGKTLVQEYQPVKGYMSSVDPIVHFGLGDLKKIDTVIVDWSNNQRSILLDIPTNQTLKLTGEKAILPQADIPPSPTLLSEVDFSIDFTHGESDFIDFDRDRLRFWSISNEGPKGASGDLDSDGLADLLLPGAKGFPSQLFFQKPEGTFTVRLLPDSEDKKLSEDIGAHFFDANQDGHLDVLVLSGSIEFGEGSPFYQDRLYLNDGQGNFPEVTQTFPSQSTSLALSLDWDQDGDLDLILGQRAAPFHYGKAVGVSLWENQGDGKFTELANQGTSLAQIGMITSGALADLDQDGEQELILAGEWMEIKIFKTQNGKFEEITEKFGLGKTNGLWNSLLVQDLNGDQLPDILAGNIGLNTRLNVKNGAKARLVINDFDQNGSWDPILTRYENGRSLPLLTKNTLIRQLPFLRKQLTTYAAYQDKSLEELFSPTVLLNSLILELDLQETSLWLNNGQGGFEKVALPIEVQFAPVYTSSLIRDSKGESYLVLGGNQSRIKPEFGTNLGSYGWVLKQTLPGEWKVLNPEISGMAVMGEIRDLKALQIKNKPHLLVLRNDQEPLLFEIR